MTWKEKKIMVKGGFILLGYFNFCRMSMTASSKRFSAISKDPYCLENFVMEILSTTFAVSV
jgi:hypothetical protein